MELCFGSLSCYMGKNAQIEPATIGYGMLYNWGIAFLSQDPFYPVQFKQPQTIECLPTCLTDNVKYSSRHLFILSPQMFSFGSKHLKCRFISPQHFRPSSSLQCLCSFTHLNIFPFIGQSQIWLCSALKGSILESLLHCWRWVWCFAGALNEAASWRPVRRLFLKRQNLMYLTSCSVVHQALPLLSLLWIELFYKGSSTQLYVLYVYVIDLHEMYIYSICWAISSLESHSLFQNNNTSLWIPNVLLLFNTFQLC